MNVFSFCYHQRLNNNYLTVKVVSTKLSTILHFKGVTKHRVYGTVFRNNMSFIRETNTIQYTLDIINTIKVEIVFSIIFIIECS